MLICFIYTAINIGFEQETYTFYETFNGTGDLIPVPIVKENGQDSELAFEVIATLLLGGGPTAAQQGVDFMALPAVQREDFGADETVINYLFEIFDDDPDVPEPTETFQITLFLAEEGLTTINLGASGGSLFATATIVIIDTDG